MKEAGHSAGAGHSNNERSAHAVMILPTRLGSHQGAGKGVEAETATAQSMRQTPREPSRQSLRPELPPTSSPSCPCPQGEARVPGVYFSFMPRPRLTLWSCPA